jgi:hypothetical protein
MVVRTLAFVIVRRVLGLVGPGPAPDAKDVETAVLRHLNRAGSDGDRDVPRVRWSQVAGPSTFQHPWEASLPMPAT